MSSPEASRLEKERFKSRDYEEGRGREASEKQHTLKFWQEVLRSYVIGQLQKRTEVSSAKRKPSGGAGVDGTHHPCAKEAG